MALIGDGLSVSQVAEKVGVAADVLGRAQGSVTSADAVSA
jgi:hypothetical protein